LREALATKQSRTACIERWIASLPLAMTERVIAGLVPAISMTVTRHCQIDRDDRASPVMTKQYSAVSQGGMKRVLFDF
jgi:hypothetical protein